MINTQPLWWQREGLAYRQDHLHLDHQDLFALARASRLPLFAYSSRRIEEKLALLRQALPEGRILYAMKSNRFLPLLTTLKHQGIDGLDVCSPRELLLARQIGFPEEQISFTATSLSEADLDLVLRHPGVWINCDSLSSIRRIGQRTPGRTIGLRINPGLGVGYQANELLRYAGGIPTKFGIYPSEWEEALALAKHFGLKVQGLHVHSGCGYLTPQLPLWSEVLGRVRAVAESLPGLQIINLGGGLGIPLTHEDEPLDLAAWSAIIRSHFGDLSAEIWIEPGDFLVKDAGVMVLEVNTVETKAGVCFVGVNGGFNLHIEPAFYGLPLEPVPCRRKEQPPTRVTIAGNINEALDLWARDVWLPPVEEGDFLAFLNAGGYGSAMSSNHCLRGDFLEYLV